jgi:hypothetical protein
MFALSLLEMEKPANGRLKGHKQIAPDPSPICSIRKDVTI